MRCRVLAVKTSDGEHLRRVAGRDRTGADGDHSPGCYRYTTATTTETTGLEPATSRSTTGRSPAELRLRNATSGPHGRRPRPRPPAPAGRLRRAGRRARSAPPH